jgi:hypothetical protein
MKPLNAALSVWRPAGAPVNDPLHAIEQCWRDVVGANVAAHSRPLQIERGTLLLVTRSSAWSQQLAFLSEQILPSVRERSGVAIERLRFRVGPLYEVPGPSAHRRKARAGAGKRRAEPREAPSLEDAVERFRAGVSAAERAKATAGWKQCLRCGVRIAPTSGPACVPCSNAEACERSAILARLLFEVPWLGYAGLAPIVGHLSVREYSEARRRLLSQWWDVLVRVRRSGGKPLTMRDRMVASSYVLLKSELEPDRIAPAVVRNLLGDELHDIFYGNEMEIAP